MTYQLSENTQRGCLYLIKHDLDFFSQIVPLIKPEYFDFPSYQRIFTSTVDYYTKYKKLPSDEALVEFVKFTSPENTKDTNDYEDDLAAINSMDQGILNDKEMIMDIIEDFAKKRALREAIKKSVLLLEQGKINDIEPLIKDAILVNRNINVGQDYFDDVRNRLNRFYVDKGKERFPTIFSSHNKNLEGGLCRKEIAMVIAPPGVGKSLYLVNQGAKAIFSGKNVLYISCEMSEDKIANRFDSVITRLKNSKLKEPSTQIKLCERLDLVKEKAQGKLIIKEFPTGQANVNQIRALLTQLKLYKSFSPDILIVDYLELLRPNRTIDAEYMAQQRIAEELRGLAVENNFLVWTASQTNRNARKVPIITDAELGDSYGKIRPADWVISLNQKPEEYDKGQMRVWVMKARDSKQHYQISVNVDYSTLKMEEATASDTNEESATE